MSGRKREEIPRTSVSANVLGDVHVKLKAFNVLIGELREELGEVAVGEAYVRFAVSMQGRMLEGGLKYGPGSWRHVDLYAELLQELLDVVNYAFLQIAKGCTESERDWLVSIAADAYSLWQDVDGKMRGEER